MKPVITHTYQHRFYNGLACTVVVTNDDSVIRENWHGQVPDMGDQRLEAEYCVWYSHVQEHFQSVIGKNFKITGIGPHEDQA